MQWWIVTSFLSGSGLFYVWTKQSSWLWAQGIHPLCRQRQEKLEDKRDFKGIRDSGGRQPSDGAGEMPRVRTRMKAGRLNQSRRSGVCKNDMVAM
jgi:hypothetical protein